MNWSPGSYGTPMLEGKCSLNDVALTGYILRDATMLSIPGNLSIIDHGNYVMEEICFYNNTSPGLMDFPQGSYCVYKLGECLHGFVESGIQMTGQVMEFHKFYRSMIPGKLIFFQKISPYFKIDSSRRLNFKIFWDCFSW